MKTIKPIYRYILLAVAVFLLVFLWTLPLLIEYYVEKNDTNWLGREIEIADVDLNIFTGKLVLYESVLYEKDSPDPFLSIGMLEANLAMLALPSSRFELEYLTIQSPQVRIVQDGSVFNFDDLLELTAGDSTAAETPGDSIKFAIHDIQLSNGNLSYVDAELSSELLLENIGVLVPTIDYRSPEIDYTLNLTQKQGGTLEIIGDINLENIESFNSILVKDWTLNPYQNYLTAYLNISHFDGYVNADLQFGGNFSDSGYVATSGRASIQDFILVDAQQDSLIRMSEALMIVDSVNTEESLYDIQTTMIDRPEILFKYFETTDSFSQLYVGEASETLDTLQVSQREIVFDNPFQYVSEYLAYFVDEEVLNSFRSDSATIRHGKIEFQDFSRLEDAVIVIEEFEATAGPITPNDSAISISLQSKINQTGELFGDLAIDRTNFSNFRFTLSIENFYISAFDPYSKHFTAFPLWEGKLNTSSNTTIKDNYLTSDNRLLIMQPEVGKKLDIETEYNIPLRFAFGLLKDVEGNVDLSLPIEGDLDDPNYKVGPIILKVLMNVLSKAVASPYKFLARALDADEDDLKAVRFGLDQDSLAAPQEKSLNLLTRVLENKEDLRARLEYVLNEKEEKDAIALKHAKTRFLEFLPDSLSSGYRSADGVDNTDSLFVVFLNKETGGLGSMSVAEMSRNMMGEEALNERIGYLRTQHMQLVQGYLFESKGIQADRVEIVEVNEPDKIASVIRPTFLIVYDALDYTGDASISGPEAPTDLAPAPPIPEAESD